MNATATPCPLALRDPTGRTCTAPEGWFQNIRRAFRPFDMAKRHVPHAKKYVTSTARRGQHLPADSIGRKPVVRSGDNRQRFDFVRR